MKGSTQFLAVAFCVTFCGTVIASSEIVVQTQNGPLQGIMKESRDGHMYVAFLGVRYAEPVTRFEPPKPLKETWTKPKLADKLGSQCPQQGPLTSVAVEEDCLFANVYAPKSAVLDSSRKGKLLVIVWIHGGGFALGAGGDYNPIYFMDNGDVIIVSFNYRLNLLGFLNLEDDVVSANNGLRDQQQVLKWIQANIASFGGDPSRVFLFGESAGAASVHHLLLSPLSKDLFSGAIMHSGAKTFWAFSPAPREVAVKVAHHLNCTLPHTTKREESFAIRKCLEEKPAADILQAQTQFWPRWLAIDVLARFKPSGDEWGLNPFFGRTKNTNPLFGGELGYPNKVPVMIGVTKDEGSTAFASAVLTTEKDTQDLNDNWNQLLPRTIHLEEYFAEENLSMVAEKVRKFYFGSEQVNFETRQNLSNLYSDSWFLGPSIVAATGMASEGLPVYPFIFNYEGKWNFRKGAQLRDLPGLVGHADELQYFFQHPFLGPPLEEGSNDEAMSERMVAFWKAFAKHGKPAAEWEYGKTLEWKPMKKSQKIADIDWLLIEKEPKIVKFPEFDGRTKFWVDLLQEHGRKFEIKQRGTTEL